MPPGDPLCPSTLSQVLAPWPMLVRNAAPTVKAWAYMDDRSLKANGSSQLQPALQATQDFDEAIGLKENQKKRQHWSQDGTVEHLGLRVQGNAQPVQRSLPQPRDGWDPVREAISRLAVVPGARRVREEIAKAFISPKIKWAVPLIEPPPADLARSIMRAVISSASTWWCSGRWWADRVALHPVLGTALQAFKAFGRQMTASATLEACMKAHAEKVALQIVSLTGGVWAKPKEMSDSRVTNAARAARRTCNRSDMPSTEVRRQATVFQVDSPAGLHAARVSARAIALASVRTTR